MRTRMKEVSLDTSRHSTPGVPPHMIPLGSSRTLLVAVHRTSSPLTVCVHMVWLFQVFSHGDQRGCWEDLRISYYQFGQKQAEEEIRGYSFRQR